MSGETSTAAPGQMGENTVLGLPVDTFAYILVGIGLGGAVLFIIVYCVAKRYCSCTCCSGHSPKHRSKYKSVREIWEQDTLQRKRDLEAAGYDNDAFSNIEELNVFSLHHIDTLQRSSSSEASNSAESEFKQMNGGHPKYKSKVKYSMSADNLYKKKRQGSTPVRMSKSSPAGFSKEVPVLQVNGETCTNTDFDQMPRNKLGSSLVRIEEEVIVEEELDVQKDKSKKKSKHGKKTHLSPELSSDGYAAEEGVDLTLSNVKIADPPRSVLTSEVVVHVNNDFQQESEMSQDANSNKELTGAEDSGLGVCDSETNHRNNLTDNTNENDNAQETKETKTIATETEPLKGVSGSVLVNKTSPTDGHTDSSDHETCQDKKGSELSVSQEDGVTRIELGHSSTTEQTGDLASRKEDIIVNENSDVKSSPEVDKPIDIGNPLPNNESFDEQGDALFKDKGLEAHLINNNVHYSLDSQADHVFRKSNGIASNGGINGLTISGKIPQNLLFQTSHLVDGTANSETDKLQSWLHDVYLARSDSSNPH